MGVISEQIFEIDDLVSILVKEPVPKIDPNLWSNFTFLMVYVRLVTAEDCSFSELEHAKLFPSDIAIAVDISLHQLINFVIVIEHGACNLTLCDVLTII